MINPAVYQITNRPIPTFLDLDAVKAQLNIYGDTSQDVYLTALAGLVQEQVEDFCGVYLQSTTFNATYVIFDSSGMVIPHNNISGLQITYFDQKDMPQMVPPSAYVIDTTGPFPVVKPVLNTVFAYTTSNTYTNPVSFSYNTQLLGAADANNIDRITHAMKIILSHWYSNRASTGIEQIKEIPQGFRFLLGKYRLPTM